MITCLLRDRSTVLTLDTELLFHLQLKIPHEGNRTKHPEVSPLETNRRFSKGIKFVLSDISGILLMTQSEGMARKSTNSLLLFWNPVNSDAICSYFILGSSESSLQIYVFN